nr:MAG TPA: hypothetical protein [Caudoviricetes sp.]
MENASFSYTARIYPGVHSPGYICCLFPDYHIILFA